MAGEHDLARLLQSLKPRLYPERYAFADAAGATLRDGQFALIREDEGLTAIEPAVQGDWARISLEVYSSLEAVGLTAEISSRLGEKGISANIVAALHHDHLFVPWDRRKEALAILHGLEGGARCKVGGRMLELFYSPGACSLVTHIALEETGEPFKPMRVTLMHGEHLTAEFLEINPHARVPALVTDNGVVTENVAILNLIGDLYSKDGSVPKGDPFDAARCNELLSWFASSVHISFAQIWRGERFTNDDKLFDAIKDGGIRALEKQFAEIEQLSGEGWLVGDSFTAADGYALVFFRWGRRIGMDMGRYPNWAALLQRILDRPAVKRAIEREGLRPEEFHPA